MTNRADISKLSLSQLVVLYNAASDVKITKFSDKPAAVKRTQKKLDTAGLLAVHILDGSVTVMTNAEFVAATTADALAEAAAKAPRTEKPVDVSKVDTSASLLTLSISVVVDGNPKRGDAAVRFQHYYSLNYSTAATCTVQAYVDLMATLGRTQRQTLADVKWDSAKGFIKLAERT